MSKRKKEKEVESLLDNLFKLRSNRSKVYRINSEEASLLEYQNVYNYSIQCLDQGFDEA